ncbi:PREDICTED: uncharacterized protein LOC109468002 [Branchiostoma belcheri]|uniref:Uncharacterized protein LOC109468002 n=1 Tax=Branchiostoma belcheri TaxID=7741 RepID=A0A6P4YIU1_BRABE|nr:PREDICTED: uncharacterized protein LOC109468002 [Branchiostoma belcheri]
MCCCKGGCCDGRCKYNGPLIRKLGWASIVLAVIGAVVAAVADGVYAGYPFATFLHISAPIWGGAFIIITGGLAVCGGNNPGSSSLRTALLVMSIFGTLSAIAIWIIAMAGQAVDGISCGQFVQGPHTCRGQTLKTCVGGVWEDNWYELFPDWRSVNCAAVRALHWLQLILGLVETLLMLIINARSCCGTWTNCTCCQGTQQQPPTQAMTYQPGQPALQQI